MLLPKDNPLHMRLGVGSLTTYGGLWRRQPKPHARSGAPPKWQTVGAEHGTWSYFREDRIGSGSGRGWRDSRRHNYRNLLRKHNANETFGDYRHGLARTLLLSLEFLVAADIVRTVAIDETSFERIGVLGLVILVRTFLGWALEVELTGRWPWQKWRYSIAPGDGQEG